MLLLFLFLRIPICYKQCPKGWYTDMKGTQCTQCPKGSYSAQEGQTSEAACIKCEAGTYPGADIAQFKCTDCPLGETRRN